MPETVSLFFLGTDCHHSRYLDVLTNFYEATMNNPNVAARLFDGVGSMPTEEMSEEHPTPGRYVYTPEGKKLKISGELSTWVNDQLQTLTGCYAGDGMNELLFEAILFLQEQIEKNDGHMPKRVNLHGFSRGADACVRLANLLDGLYPDLEVNLFLIDQVPGDVPLARRVEDPNSYVIPQNVKRLEAAVMLHENTPGFDPQDKDRYVFADPQTTEVAIKVYPGPMGKPCYLMKNDKWCLLLRVPRGQYS